MKGSTSLSRAVCVSFPMLVAGLIAMQQSILVSANSAGQPGTCLNIDLVCDNPSNPPCKKEFKKQGFRKCCPYGMDNVRPPLPREKLRSPYHIRASVKEYTPCERMKITLDVTQKDKKYLGLYLYAVADNGKTGAEEQKVGKWANPKHYMRMKFHNPDSCGQLAVTHDGPAIKPYSTTFYFRAPVQNTGPIRFRALIKYGETNGGSFHYAKEIVLREKKVSPSSTLIQWVRTSTTKPETCSAACRIIGGTCNSNEMMRSVNQKRKDTFDSASKSQLCSFPVFTTTGTDCAHRGVLSRNANKQCFYRDDQCQSVANNICERSVTGGKLQQMCACNVPASKTLSICPADDDEKEALLQVAASRDRTRASAMYAKSILMQRTEAVDAAKARLAHLEGSGSEEEINAQKLVLKEAVENLRAAQNNYEELNTEAESLDVVLTKLQDPDVEVIRETEGDAEEGGMPNLSDSFYIYVGGGIGVAAVATLLVVRARKSSSEASDSEADVWKEYFDPQTNRAYWHNTKTGATTWVNPHAKKLDVANPLTKDAPNLRSLRFRKSSSVRRKV